MISTQIAVRPALLADHTSIANLMYFEPHVHRHLDWRGALEWLGAPEYWVLERNGAIQAALACPPDPENVSWLRLFAHSSELPIGDAWNALWETAKTSLQGRKLVAAAITVSDWFSGLLLDSGFKVTQYIVVLEKNSSASWQIPIPPDVVLRAMTVNDLPAITEVDKAGFAPLWRNSFEALQSGFAQSGFATVALVNGEVVGYQLSTRNSFGLHLARLAVTPRLHGRGIGSLLVQDLFIQGWRAGLHRFTVNTQNDNRASLSLYKKIGYELTGERYTVFTCPIE